MLIALTAASVASVMFLGLVAESVKDARSAFLHSCIGYVLVLSMIYGVDAVFTIPTGQYRVVFSAGMMSLDMSAVNYVLAVVIWTVCLIALIAPLVRMPGDACLHRQVAGSKLAVLGGVVVALLISAVASRGLEQFLTLRAQAFSESRYALPALFVGPPVAALSIFVGVKQRQMSLVALGGVVVLALAMVGSRTSVFIAVVLPLAHFSIMNRRGSLMRSRLRPLLVAAAMIGLGSLVWFASATFSSLTRASAAAARASWYNGSDFSSFDAFVDIVQNDVRAEWSFMSSAFRVIPLASQWAPEPGGTQYSLARFPERLSSTGSAATPSLLGEMFMNFGSLAPVMAALVLIAVCVFAASGGRLGLDRDYANLFRLLVLYRGINLIRGDLHDSVIGMGAILAVFLIASERVGSTGVGVRWRSRPGSGRPSRLFRLPDAQVRTPMSGLP